MHKEGNKLCIIYPLIYGSVLITFTVRVTKTTSCQYKFSKKIVQRIIEAQSVLSSENQNKASLPVFYRRIKYPYSFGCFNSYAPIFHSAIKHGDRCFIS